MDLTNEFKKTLTSVVVEDYKTATADSVTLKFAYSKKIGILANNQKISIAIGLGDELYGLGNYFVDGEVTDSPAGLKIRANSSPFFSSDEKKQRAWNQRTIKEIVFDIARGKGLNPYVENIASLTEKRFDFYQNESHLSFVRRIAQDLGFKTKISSTTLGVYLSTSPGDEVIKYILPFRGYVWNWKSRPLATYKAVQACYWDTQKKRQEWVTWGKPEGPVYTVKYQLNSYKEAATVVENTLSRIKDQKDTLELNLPSEPGHVFTKIGIGHEVEYQPAPRHFKNWVVTRATHELSWQSQKLETRIQCISKKSRSEDGKKPTAD